MRLRNFGGRNDDGPAIPAWRGGSLLALALASVLEICHAAEPSIRFDQPAQPLAAALQAIAEASGLKLLYADAAVHGREAAPLQGSYTVRKALETVLGNSGLHYEFVSENMVAVKDTAESKKPKTDNAKPTVLEEMIVTAKPTDDTSYTAPNASTATKTDTPILETPYSIQVIPQQVLRDQQVTRIEKALENVSGVFQTESGGANAAFIVRGFATQDIYRDGVRIPGASQIGGTEEPANLERIEVLKGPASILYGRIELGGLINQVTKKPLATPYYSFEQQFGSFDLYRTILDATGPITEDDTLSYRFNLAYENSDSFIELLRTHEQVFVAPRLRWQPSEDTQADLYVEYTNASLPFDSGLVPWAIAPPRCRAGATSTRQKQASM